MNSLLPTLFTYSESVIFCILLLAHLLSDFAFQPTAWVMAKKQHGPKATAFWYHILCTLAMLAGSAFLLYVLNIVQQPTRLIWVVGVTVATHLLIDWGKFAYEKKHLTPVLPIVPAQELRQNKQLLRAFGIDQLLHLLVVAGSWLWLTNYSMSSGALLSAVVNGKILSIIIGYLLCQRPAAIIIGSIMAQLKVQDQTIISPLAKPFDEHEPNPADDQTSPELLDAGTWIGMSERFIVLTFVLLQQYPAIGFLATAKSLLRFREGDRKFSEYVLVGTFLSFAFAIATGLLIRVLMKE